MAALRKSESPGLRLAVTLIHLSLWAQLGVVTRTFLGKFFLLGCSGGWGPCLQGSFYFKDLPANMLGSFFIGLFAASSTVGLAVDKAMALLPRTHAWQSNFELQIGIRTGYCGSLTTFASWILELMVPAIQDNKWVEAGMGLLVGLVAAISSYKLGMHAALAIDRWLVGEADVLEQLERYRSSQLHHLEGLARDSGELPEQQLMMQAEPDIPRLVPHEPSAARELHRQLQQRQHDKQQHVSPAQENPEANMGGALGIPSHGSQAVTDGVTHAAAAAATAPAVASCSSGGSRALAAGMSAGPPISAPLLVPQQQRGAKHQAGRYAAAIPGEHAAEAALADTQQRHIQQRRLHHQQQQEEHQEKQPQQQQQQQHHGHHHRQLKQQRRLSLEEFGSSLRGYRTDAAALALLAALTALAAVGLGLEEQHTWLRLIWLSVLLGPPGCVLRWWLSCFNYRLQGGWDWLPAGTFAANMLGVAIDFSLQCVLQRRPEALGYWGTLAVQAVQTGFGGCLTTVSTFVTEVVKFADAIPENYHAYRYACMSLGGAVVLALALFGWSVWAYE